ncbi:MAG: TerB family tellurite resistance protein [Cytophagales bacterium]|nr:MAG: TerB family tellurite resistance protein [Cytophagales bacterium]
MKSYNQLSELEKYKIKNHIGSLAKLVMIDGKLSKSEAEKILTIAERYGFPKIELVELIREGYEALYIVPATSDEKLEQLFDFVSVTLADGSIAMKELDLCKQIAASLKIDTSKINSLIMAMVDCIQEDKDFEKSKERLHLLF